MNLSSFRGQATLYGAAGKKEPTDFTGADDIIKIGLTKVTRSADDRVDDYVRDGCVDAGVVHFLFDSHSNGVLIPFHAKAFETVVHFLVRRRICESGAAAVYEKPTLTAPFHDFYSQIRTFKGTRLFTGACKCGAVHREFFEAKYREVEDMGDARELKMMQLGECFVHLLLEWVDENIEAPAAPADEE